MANIVCVAGICPISCCCCCCCCCPASVTRWFSAASSNSSSAVCDRRPWETPTHTTTVGIAVTCTQVSASRAGRADPWRESRPAYCAVDLCTSPLSDDEERAEAHERVSQGQGL